MFDVDPPIFPHQSRSISGIGMDCENHGEKQGFNPLILPGARAGGRSSDFAGHGGDIARPPCRGSTGAGLGKLWKSNASFYLPCILVILVICSDNPPLTQGKNKSLGFSEHHLIILY